MNLTQSSSRAHNLRGQQALDLSETMEDNQISFIEPRPAPEKPMIGVHVHKVRASPSQLRSRCELLEPPPTPQDLIEVGVGDTSAVQVPHDRSHPLPTSLSKSLIEILVRSVVKICGNVHENVCI